MPAAGQGIQSSSTQATAVIRKGVPKAQGDPPAQGDQEQIVATEHEEHMQTTIDAFILAPANYLDQVQYAAVALKIILPQVQAQRFAAQYADEVKK